MEMKKATLEYEYRSFEVNEMVRFVPLCGNPAKVYVVSRFTPPTKPGNAGRVYLLGVETWVSAENVEPWEEPLTIPHRTPMYVVSQPTGRLAVFGPDKAGFVALNHSVDQVREFLSLYCKWSLADIDQAIRDGVTDSPVMPDDGSVKDNKPLWRWRVSLCRILMEHGERHLYRLLDVNRSIWLSP